MSVVSSTPDILGGTPVFAGTRVPVQTFFEYQESGDSIDEFLDDFPTVDREQVTALLAGRVYMPLLEEGTDVWRPVLAQPLGGDTFLIVAGQPCHPEDETWTFPPGSVVRCREQLLSGRQVLVACELVHLSADDSGAT